MILLPVPQHNGKVRWRWGLMASRGAHRLGVRCDPVERRGLASSKANCGAGSGSDSPSRATITGRRGQATNAPAAGSCRLRASHVTDDLRRDRAHEQPLTPRHLVATHDEEGGPAYRTLSKRRQHRLAQPSWTRANLEERSAALPPQRLLGRRPGRRQRRFLVTGARRWGRKGVHQSDLTAPHRSRSDCVVRRRQRLRRCIHPRNHQRRLSPVVSDSSITLTVADRACHFLIESDGLSGCAALESSARPSEGGLGTRDDGTASMAQAVVAH